MGLEIFSNFSYFINLGKKMSNYKDKEFLQIIDKGISIAKSMFFKLCFLADFGKILEMNLMFIGLFHQFPPIFFILIMETLNFWLIP